ncbi:MAG: hypothetical protein FJ267_13475, partial [Planctomycetes bacterium]|nr:hypothetical protein [Planctomycetota bacterium]
MRSTSRLCVSGVCICLLTIAFSGCGQSESGVTDSVSNQDEHRSFLPTVAIPGPKPSANKGNGNASKPVIGKPNTGKSAAEKPTNGKSGSTTKTNDAGASKKSQATSKDGEVDDAAVAKEPEKGSPDWLLVEIQKIRITPLPGSDEDEDDESEEDDDESDQEKDDKDPTPEEDARLAKLFEDQKKVRRERNLQIVKLAEECIAKTNKKPEFEAQFDSAAHQLLDARLQLAL